MDVFSIEYETVIDGAEAGAAAPSPEPAAGAGEGDPSAPATETAPAWTPEQIAALRENPEFQEMFATEASTIAEARFQALIEQNRSQPQPQQNGGEQVDINEFLNPLNDNFGQNLATVLELIGQRVDQTVNGALAPLQQQAETVQAAERDQVLQAAITDAATGLGGLKGGDQAVQRVMQAVRNQYMPEATRMYGQTDRAAQVAIDRAVRSEHAYQASVAGTSAVEDAQHLATVNGAPAVINGGTAPAGVTAISGELLRGQQIVQKYSGLAAAINGR